MNYSKSNFRIEPDKPGLYVVTFSNPIDGYSYRARLGLCASLIAVRDEEHPSHIHFDNLAYLVMLNGWLCDEQGHELRNDEYLQHFDND